MDPQAFIRVSVGSLGLRVPTGCTKSGIRALSSSPCECEIRLRGFHVQTTSIPFVSSPEAIPDMNRVASSFYLEESDLRALMAPGCFYRPVGCLEIVVFTGNKTHCGVGGRRQQIGTFKLVVGPEWCRGKPVVLFNGWIGIGNGKNKPGVELHLRVKLDPDPRYIFQFEDKTKLSPQIFQLHGSLKQPIFSCKFSQERASQVGRRFWSSSSNLEMERRGGRKGWKVTIHDLSGSAVAAAFMTTPFVPSTGCDWVARSNLGTWLIVHPDGCWQPWGKLEAWREQVSSRDYICCRFHLLRDNQEHRDLLMSQIFISAERGGYFYIDTDTQVPTASPRSSRDCPVSGGFVMSCRVQGEGRPSKPLVQLAKRYVTCVEDAAVFIALAAAVDLSIEACKPFPRSIRHPC